ncbi:MAG TPA: glycosyltransferase family 2 protein [Verrucomicrobiae bacterium]|nr:glycosyltransferase family 2 protein [Verrucomicrobiae bacterium]
MAIAVFAASVAAILYILFGYPLLLGFISHRWAKPVAKSPQRKSVSVVIAVHNGERFIGDKLESVLALNYPRDLMEIVVVSDGSDDQTDAIVEGFAARGVNLLRVPRGGKCAALNAGISQSRNEILLLTDVRQKLDPDSLQALMDCFADPAVGAASGELVVRQGTNSDEASTGLYWRYESWIRRNLSQVDSMFGATGPFYALRRDLAVPIPQDILLDDMYLPLNAFFRGYRLINEPRAKAFDYPTTREVEFKRKVRTLAGNYQILRVYPALLGPRNRMWFHYMSYKVARLILPWIFVALLASSCFLPTPLRWIALGVQGIFYFLALVDPWIPAGFILKKYTSLARTFVALLLAAVRGISVLVVPPRSLWQETKIAAHHS